MLLLQGPSPMHVRPGAHPPSITWLLERVSLRRRTCLAPVTEPLALCTTWLLMPCQCARSGLCHSAQRGAEGLTRPCQPPARVSKPLLESPWIYTAGTESRAGPIVSAQSTPAPARSTADMSLLSRDGECQLLPRAFLS